MVSRDAVPQAQGPWAQPWSEAPRAPQEGGAQSSGEEPGPGWDAGVRVVVLLEAPSTSPSGRATGGFQVCWPPEEKPFAPALEGARSPEGDQTRECRGSSSVGAAQPFPGGGSASTVHRGLAPLRLQVAPATASELAPHLPAPASLLVPLHRESQGPERSRLRLRRSPAMCFPKKGQPQGSPSRPPATWPSVSAALGCRVTAPEAALGRGVRVCEPM